VISRDKVLKRLTTIQSYYRILEQKLALSKEEFLSNADNYLAAERVLQLISEAMIDIGNHIVSRRQLGKPETYGQIFQLLGDHDIITVELGKKLVAFAGLRNILVHDYIGLDRSQLYKDGQKNKGDILDFINQIQQFITNEK
jgi:uncharacterized protein YutE (UPF0331/DUF86 family)